MSYSANFFGVSSKAASRGVASGYQSGHISDIVEATPVSVNGVGMIFPTDVTSESSVNNFVGLTNTLIHPSASGQVTSAGRIEALTLSGFNLGDAIYAGKNSTLINVKPNYGVLGFGAGDFVIFLGVVVKNEFDPSKKDILLMAEIIGQL